MLTLLLACFVFFLPHVIQQYQTTWLEVVAEARVVRARQAALADLHTRNAGFHATLAGDSQVHITSIHLVPPLFLKKVNILNCCPQIVVPNKFLCIWYVFL